MNRCFLFKYSTLRSFCIGLGMLRYHVYTFNKCSVLVAVYVKNAALLAFRFAGYDHNRIAFLYMNLLLHRCEFYYYNTSGASETIFMYLSRSSRATGPNIRVPRTSLTLFSGTTALSSDLVYDPSARRISSV